MLSLATLAYNSVLCCFSFVIYTPSLLPPCRVVCYHALFTRCFLFELSQIKRRSRSLPPARYPQSLTHSFSPFFCLSVSLRLCSRLSLCCFILSYSRVHFLLSFTVSAYGFLSLSFRSLSYPAFFAIDFSFSSFSVNFGLSPAFLVLCRCFSSPHRRFCVLPVSRSSSLSLSSRSKFQQNSKTAKTNLIFLSRYFACLRLKTNCVHICDVQ